MKKVLIIDDEALMLDFFHRVMTIMGYHIVLADNCETAFDHFQQESFDLIIIDVLMPGKNGFEIAREILALNPHQKILMTSGSSGKALNELAQAEDISIFNILFKPFTYNDIKIAINRMYLKGAHQQTPVESILQKSAAEDRPIHAGY